MNTEPIETTAIGPVPLLPTTIEPIEPSTPRTDAAQARVDAVANVLHKAYENASMLRLTPEEEEALTADFEDADFRTGAAGKDNLIYLEHASLRQRLNKVIGVGQWSLVARNRWTETFQYWDKDTKSYQDANRVYVEAVLLIRGCFTGEAVGDMVYYPKNNSTNFGDAVEGAKSAAFRRCAKELGVGLQAWKKDFGEGWFARNKNGRPPQRLEYVKSATNPTIQQSNNPASGDEGGFDSAATKPTVAQKHAAIMGDPAAGLSIPPPAASQPPGAPETPAAKKERFLALFRTFAAAADKVFRDHGLVLPTDDACDIDDVKIANMTNANVRALLEEVKQVHGGKEPPVLSEGDAPLPNDLHKPEDFTVHPPTEEPWRLIKTPFKLKEVPAGTPLGNLGKGQLWWWVMIYKPDRRQDKKSGKWYDPRPSDISFYQTLQPYRQGIITRYDFQPPDERD